MSWLGFPLRLFGRFLLLGLLSFGVTPWLACFLDRGSSGTVRVSVFPLVLTLFDPFVWTCVVNSTGIALAVTAGSLAIGVGLAVAGASRGYRGRSLLWAMAMVPMVAGPLLVAPGIGQVLANPRGWEWLAARSVGGYSLEDLVRWMALIWVGVAAGSPVVGLATAFVLRRIEPAWIDAARASGASRRQIWRDIIWPILRPEAAQAAAVVFTLTLIEPAGPFILGLNRTLAVQILQSVLRFDSPTRPAALALLAFLIVLIGRSIIGGWGGLRSNSLRRAVNFSSEPAGFRRRLMSRLFLVGWLVFAVGPIAVLLVRSFQSLQSLSAGPWMGFLELLINDPELNGWAANSATTAALAVLLDLVILASLRSGRPDGGGRVVRMASSYLLTIPPLALGVGALVSPWLLDALADSVSGRPADWVRFLSAELNPARAPGVLLILVVAAGKWPILLRVAGLAREEFRPVLVDASRLMGQSNREANPPGWSSAVPARAMILILVLAATNLAPALLLAPFSERRTLAPAIIEAIHTEGLIDSRIALAILVVLGGRIVAFSLGSRTQIGSLADWYRG